MTNVHYTANTFITSTIPLPVSVITLSNFISFVYHADLLRLRLANEPKLHSC